MTAKRQMLIRSSATCEKTSNRYLAFGYLFWVLTNYDQNMMKITLLEFIWILETAKTGNKTFF